MKKYCFLAFLLISVAGLSQDINIVMKEAQNAERTLKEDIALDKYKQALSIDQDNITALIKVAEINLAKGAREKDKKAKKALFETAAVFAAKAKALGDQLADVQYLMSALSMKLAEVEPENKKAAAYIKDAKAYADRALEINPDHVKANYAAGRWHFEMVQTAWVKKLAVKTLFGGLPDATIEDAIKHMEKARALDQYFVANHLELAKTYRYDNKPAPAMEVLKKLVKLPNRTPDDVALKAEGQKLLDEMR